MTNARSHFSTYDPQVWTHAVKGACGLVVLIFGAAPLIWLDGGSVHALGWAPYPIEHLCNAILFPDVMTPVRSNGAALFVLAPTLALIGLAIFALRTALAFVLRLRHFWRERVR